MQSFLCKACFDPLGIENKKITDGQITASTEYNAGTGATNGRLNFKPGEGKTGAWSPRQNDVHQWLQVDFEGKTEVTGIEIRTLLFPTAATAPPIHLIRTARYGNQ